MKNFDKKTSLISGMNSFISKTKKQKEIYKEVWELTKQMDNNTDPIFQIEDECLFKKIILNFGPQLDPALAKEDLRTIYQVAIHLPTKSIIIANVGATLFSRSPLRQIPYITRHIGFCLYIPDLGVEMVNVGIVGDIYNHQVLLRSESACTPSFLFGSERCNCAHQWESIRELAANYNEIKNVPETSSGREFEKWVQKEFHYQDGKHISNQPGKLGVILMHLDSQNGMGSGYTHNEFSFDLYSRASMRHRGEYSSEQLFAQSMWGGFETIGLSGDPRREGDEIGYKVTVMVLNFLKCSKDLIFLSNNPLKIKQLESAGYKITRVKSIGEVMMAGAQEALERGTEFGHLDIDDKPVTFKEEFSRLTKEIDQCLLEKSVEQQSEQLVEELIMKLNEEVEKISKCSQVSTSLKLKAEDMGPAAGEAAEEKSEPVSTVYQVARG